MTPGTPTPIASLGARLPPLLARAGDLQNVGELGTRGIRKVRLVSQSDLEAAIRDAVSRELLDCLAGIELPEDQRRRVESRALSRLSGDTPAPAPRATESGADLGATQAITAFDFRAMEQRLLDEIGRLVSQNWREGLESGRDGQRDQIQRLERRIESLMRALDQVERMMDRVPAAGRSGAAAAGVPRPEPGPLGGMKKDLLEQLFQANLVLRELEAGEERQGGATPGNGRR
jgi:hypothetical protein